MDNITNIQQATEYVYKLLKELNPDIDKDDVYDTIMDEILESIEYIMTDEDITAIDEYLQSKIPDYKDLLSDIVVDMVSDEIIETE